MERGPIEQEFVKMWQGKLEGAPGMLEATLEGRDLLTADEWQDVLVRMLGATRDGFLMVTREIDKLNAARD